MGANGKTTKGKVLPSTWAGDQFWEPDRQMETILDRLGYKWEYVQYNLDDLPEINTYDSHGQTMTSGTGRPNQLQVRAHTHEDVVASYEAALRRGERLPTTTWDKTLQEIDAHHRALAARRVGITHYVIIRLKDTLDAGWRRYIATIRNNSHGLRQTPAEVMAAALNTIREKGLPVDDVAHELNISASSIRRALDDERIQARAKGLGVGAEFSRLTKGVRLEMDNLNDPTFKELTKVLDQSQPRGEKAIDIIKEVKDTKSEKKGLEVIKRVKEVDLAPLSARRGNTTPRGITTPKTPREAYKLAQPALTAFVTLMTNQSVVDGLTATAVTDPSFSKVHSALTKIKPSFDKLCAHFGV